MLDRIIPIADARDAVAPAAIDFADDARRPNGHLADTLGRPLRDLRISVTDRCNFRCAYCMPKEVFDRSHAFLPQRELMSFEEIARVAGVFVGHGVRKIRLTGGEPLLRRHLEGLVEMLAGLRTPQGDALDLTLTTNGSLLARKARALKAAGLNRVTVSLDALDDAVFRRMNDVDFPVDDVLRGIEAAREAGFAEIKVNTVVQRGVNETEILPLARRFRHSGIALRFIEYMDVGATNGWRVDQVLPSADVLHRLAAAFALEPIARTRPGETARRWRYRDGGGEIGLISSVTQAFCGDCNRARLSTDGKLFLCLFASRGHDLRALLRSGADDAELASRIGRIWRARTDRYSELRSAEAPRGDRSDAAAAAGRRIEMHYIGG